MQKKHLTEINKNSVLRGDHHVCRFRFHSLAQGKLSDPRKSTLDRYSRLYYVLGAGQSVRVLGFHSLTLWFAALTSLFTNFPLSGYISHPGWRFTKKEIQWCSISIGRSLSHWPKIPWHHIDVTTLCNEHWTSNRSPREPIHSQFVEYVRGFLGRLGWPNESIIYPITGVTWTSKCGCAIRPQCMICTVLIGL